jgi:hypothetical protein
MSANLCQSFDLHINVSQPLPVILTFTSMLTNLIGNGWMTVV